MLKLLDVFARIKFQAISESVMSAGRTEEEFLGKDVLKKQAQILPLYILFYHLKIIFKIKY
jgi:hypothetical protein